MGEQTAVLRSGTLASWLGNGCVASTVAGRPVARRKFVATR